MASRVLDRIKDGRTDLVFDYLSEGHPASAQDENGMRLVQWCWASWYLRPDAILRRLCYGGFSIHPGRRSMEANLLGVPHRRA